jgi:hypothetical protein
MPPRASAQSTGAKPAAKKKRAEQQPSDSERAVRPRRGAAPSATPAQEPVQAGEAELASETSEQGQASQEVVAQSPVGSAAASLSGSKRPRDKAVAAPPSEQPAVQPVHQAPRRGSRSIQEQRIDTEGCLTTARRFGDETTRTTGRCAGRCASGAGSGGGSGGGVAARVLQRHVGHVYGSMWEHARANPLMGMALLYPSPSMQDCRCAHEFDVRHGTAAPRPRRDLHSCRVSSVRRMPHWMLASCSA